MRSQCPAKRSKCYKCGNYGHFAKQCCSRNKQLNYTTTSGVAALNAENGAPHKVNVQITVNGVQANALIDTGSTLSQINRTFALQHNFTQCNERNEIGLAVTGNCFQSDGFCLVTICMQNRSYSDMKLPVLDNLLTDVISGQDFLKLHNHVQINFGEPKPALRIIALDCIKTDVMSRLFDHLTNECKPIITKSRKHSMANEKFIAETIKNDLLNGVIEPSTSPWRAQVLVATGENHRKRMIITIIIIFIYLPSDVISPKKTATSSRSITKASKYAIPLKPTHKLAESKRYLVTW